MRSYGRKGRSGVVTVTRSFQISYVLFVESFLQLKLGSVIIVLQGKKCKSEMIGARRCECWYTIQWSSFARVIGRELPLSVVRKPRRAVFI